MPTKATKRIYGHLEHPYASAFATALEANVAFRSWVLGKTKFVDRDQPKVLRAEMESLRTSRSAPWWKNYFTYSCSCFGCVGGRETDIFIVFEDSALQRFALHIEVKQPSDIFTAASRQGERYALRSKCWSQSAPPTVPLHSDASTIILCAESKLSKFAAEIEHFDTLITIEDTAQAFPVLGFKQ